MNTDTVQKILTESMKYLTNPSVITDPYDMSLVWMREDVKEQFKLDATEGKPISSFIIDITPHDAEDLSKMSTTVSGTDVTTRTGIYKLLNTGEHKKMTHRSVLITIDNQPYIITEQVSAEDYSL